MSITDLFVIVSQASVLLPVIIGLVSYKKLTFSFRVLFCYFLLGIGFEILAYTTKVIYHNNMPGLHLFSIVQFLIFSMVYYWHFDKNDTLRRLILANVIVAFLIALGDALFIDGILSSNIFARSYDGICIIIYTLIYLYQLFRRDTQHYNRNDPMFWFTIAALIYFANNILYFMLREYLLTNAKKIEAVSYLIYLCLNIIAHFLYAQSFRCFSKWKTES